MIRLTGFGDFAHRWRGKRPSFKTGCTPVSLLIKENQIKRKNNINNINVIFTWIDVSWKKGIKEADYFDDKTVMHIVVHRRACILQSGTQKLTILFYKKGDYLAIGLICVIWGLVLAQLRRISLLSWFYKLLLAVGFSVKRSAFGTEMMQLLLQQKHTGLLVWETSLGTGIGRRTDWLWKPWILKEIVSEWGRGPISRRHGCEHVSSE